MRAASDRTAQRHKKRTGFGPHPESEHPGQTRLECRSRTAISCDSHERREQHFRRPAEKSGQVLVRTQKANTPARRGWNADRAQPFLVIAARDASSISDDRRKSGQVLVRTQKANTPARRGWNADRAQPFLVIAARDASSISDDRQKSGQVLVRTEPIIQMILGRFRGGMSGVLNFERVFFGYGNHDFCHSLSSYSG